MRGDEYFHGCLLLDETADPADPLRELPSRGGVLLFAGDGDQPLQLLHGRNLRQLARRRLQADAETGPSRQVRLRQVARRLWFRRGDSDFENELAYHRIAPIVLPERYAEQFKRLQTWMLELDQQAPYPRFAVTDRYRPGPHRRIWGPINTRRAAEKLLQALEDIFGLCRCPEVLHQAPRARPCSYAQMGRCAVVCDGTVEAEAYRQLVGQAAVLLDRPVDETEAAWRAEMRQWAGALKFEQAQAVKQRLQQLQVLRSRDFAWFGPMEAFRVLAFLPGPKVKVPRRRQRQQTISAFLISPSSVAQMEAFPLAEAQAAAAALLDHWRYEALREAQSPNAGSGKQLAWVANYLYNKSAGQGVFLRARDDLDAATLTADIERFFATPQEETAAGTDAVDAEPDQNTSTTGGN